MAQDRKKGDCGKGHLDHDSADRKKPDFVLGFDVHTRQRSEMGIDPGRLVKKALLGLDKQTQENCGKSPLLK